jgi:hypothetical protein
MPVRKGEELVEHPDAALEHLGATQLAPLEGFSSGLDSIMPDRFPVISIYHPSSEGVPAGCELGQFYNRVTGEYFSTRRLVLLDSKPSRIALPPMGSENRAPYCTSDDGINPTGRGVDPQSGPCGTVSASGFIPRCWWAKWGEKDPQTGRATKPKCAAQVLALFEDLDASIPVMMSLRSTALPAFGALKSQLFALRPRLTDKKAPEIPVNYLVQIEISSEAKSKGGMKWWVPKFTVLTDPKDRIPSEQARVLWSMTKDMRHTVSDVHAEEGMAMEDAAPSNPMDDEPLPF